MNTFLSLLLFQKFVPDTLEQSRNEMSSGMFLVGNNMFYTSKEVGNDINNLFCHCFPEFVNT